MNTLINEWKWAHTMSEKDLYFLQKPVKSSFNGMVYGTYCGPFTNLKYDDWYKNDDPRGDPIDALDFLCLLHDRYFKYPESDDALLNSVKILTDMNIMKGKFNIYGGRLIVKIIRKLFSFYRWIIYYLL